MPVLGLPLTPITRRRSRTSQPAEHHDADAGNDEPNVLVVCHLSAEGSNTGRDAVEQPDDDQRDGDRGHAVSIPR